MSANASTMNFGELIARLRATHVPQGTADAVLLRPLGYGFLEVSAAEAKAAIGQFEEMGRRHLFGEKASPLERLGILLLVQSADVHV